MEDFRANGLKIHLSVKNTGNYNAHTVLFLYIRDVEASTIRRVRELKDFQKLWIPKGGIVSGKLMLDEEKLSLWNSEMEFVMEPGEFELLLNDGVNDVWKGTVLISYGIVCIGVIIAFILYFSQKVLATKKVTISADYPIYDSLEELAGKADTIIKGKITGFTYKDLNVTEESQSDDERLNPGGEKDNSVIPYTVFTVEIEEVYKGTVREKDTIQIKTLGGIAGDTEYFLEDSGETGLEEGKKYVLFLETYSNSPASLLNPIQIQL